MSVGPITVFVHAAFGDGEPRWQPLNVAALLGPMPSREMLVGECPGSNRRHRPGTTVATRTIASLILPLSGLSVGSSNGSEASSPCTRLYSKFFDWSSFYSRHLNSQPFVMAIFTCFPIIFWPFTKHLNCVSFFSLQQHSFFTSYPFNKLYCMFLPFL